MSQQQQPSMGVPPTAGTPSNTQTGPSQADYLKKLNTYIYDYFLRNQHYEVARAMMQDLPGDMKPGVKQSPNMRQGQQNGADEDADSRDTDQGILKRPDDLPLPDLPGVNQGPFLQDWWSQFWDIWTTHRGKGKNNSTTYSFVGHQRQAQKARNNMTANAMDPQSVNNMRQMNYMQMNGGRGPNDLQRAAMTNQGKNLNPQQLAQFQQMQRQQQMMGNPMERQGSQMDMGGPRSGSPGSGEAPSPKRQRLDGNMQPLQGRPPLQSNQVGPPPTSLPPDDPRAVHTAELLMRKGIDPGSVAPETLLDLQQQPANHQTKSVEVYSASIGRQMQQAMQNHSNMNKGMPTNPAAMGPGGAQGSPMSQAGMDTAQDFYAANGHMRLPPNAAAAAAAQSGAANQQGGNHALQDYQMQLMLLEQQNKKRLLMARQEQDSMAHPGAPNGQAFQAPQMSPQGSRQGPSPNPNEMQRGTPKMGKAGLSPNGEMVGRGSPAPGGFDPNQMPPQMRQQIMMAQGPNGQPMMRPPPSSHPQFANGQQMDPQQVQMMQAQRMQQMPNGQWQGGPQMPPQMMQGQQAGQQPPNSTPRQGNQQMPPPPAPPAGQGTQPGSPAQQPAPPTPNQANKPKPGAKKETKGSKKAGNKKGNAQPGATPASEAEQPPTPTPATPATPSHANSFAHNKNQQLPNGNQAPTPQQQAQQLPNQQQQQQQQPQHNQGAPPVQQPGPPSDVNQAFGHLGDDMSMGPFDFSNPLDGGTDVLDNFDFDSFLNAGEDSFGGFESGMDFGDGLQAEMNGQ